MSYLILKILRTGRLSAREFQRWAICLLWNQIATTPFSNFVWMFQCAWCSPMFFGSIAIWVVKTDGFVSQPSMPTGPTSFRPFFGQRILITELFSWFPNYLGSMLRIPSQTRITAPWWLLVVWWVLASEWLRRCWT
jgi:hypothetical protein